MPASRLAAATLAAAFALSLTACGSDSDTAATATTSSPSAAASPSAAMTGEFGSACSAIPADPSNPGSFESMAKAPVATAASGNPLLKTLVTAVTKAKLGDSLNSASAITVFAPTNDAFAKIPAANLDKVLADNKTLTSVLTYHVVPERLSRDQLAGTHKTLQGGSVEVAGSGADFTVNGNAAVLCGNVQTANATVYIIDTVLMPKA